MRRKRTWDAVAENMPQLKHSASDPFDWSTSEVAAWLSRQPTILRHIFNTCSRSGRIVYDSATGTWRGKNVKPRKTVGYQF